ncbi:polyprenol phosphomannose-dependent alpha 1,6 mannosyltransferase MptB [Pseudonocardia alaniniphila]|uniref:Polyprenol phosphomannose-dependent alpha 1,6 mannosyltransferase MptB n=1 Tax=Pseudonocardia alaniniphila TaxID=75291 RepID=A0ABS9TGT4_9PSEU|nr:polyprenol phosphomannose-dependent alpha 1,6 mannosyltransferase MptB [Pseudonocardia alaniniphila]MCH6167741.1 polyprenol phosphomannose-dependent alpha 1,6 mannosyltransferase MptB [Pseudonocardia alaniniphila]
MVAGELDGARAPVPVEAPPRDPSRAARRLGLTGTLLMGVGALGSGALPVPNPLFGLRLLGLPSRNATIAIAITYAGIGLLVVAWLWIGKMLRSNGAVAPAPNRAQLARTAVLWAIPLAVAPPLFSRDVYSYLAQSAILARGLDPYVLGPAQALGVDDPLTRSIPTIWRDTPAPYGPFFLWLGRGITALTGNDVVLGLFAHRVLALMGVGLIVWAIPKLARRCGLDTGLALWLGAANPLVLFHLVSGIHNESLMIGMMLAGMEIGLRAGPRVLDARFLCGALLIVGASAVKIPALLALGFLGTEWARRRGGRVRDVAVSAGVLGGVTVVGYGVLALVTGLGLGWVTTLDTPSLIRSWMSVSTDLGLIGGQVGIVGGLGDHTDTVLVLTRGLGGLAGGVVVLILLLASLRGRLDPVTGMGVGLGAVVLLGPIVHPWYLLWAAIPLAATQGLPRYRRAALAASAILALLVPPTGADFNFRAYQLPMAIVAGLVMLVLLLLVQRRQLAGQQGVDVDAWPGRVPTPGPDPAPH